jgi:hypothetical protein
MVAEVGYDDDLKAMVVRWARSGKTSAYIGVPEDVAVDCSKAASVGEFINSDIKPNYEHRYI